MNLCTQNMLLQLNIKPISKLLVRLGKAGNVLLKCDDASISGKKLKREKKRTILGEIIVSLVSKLQSTYSSGRCSKPSPHWL